MALYIPVSRRRRNAALVAIATLLVGLLIGFLVGRSTAVTADEAARDIRSRGDTLGTRVEALTIEYEQAVAGVGDTVQAGVLDALDLIDIDVDRLVADAPWIGAGQTEALHSATAAVRTAAMSGVDPSEFATVTAATAATIRTTFGVDD